MGIKKRTQLIANNSLRYFIKMFQEGGSYNEIADRNKNFFKIIKYDFPKSQMSISIPMNEEEYNYWRKIKPVLKQGDKINEK